VLHRPIGIAADNEDNVYVADYINGRIIRFGNTLVQNLSFSATPGSEPGRLVAPVGVAVDDNGHVFVADAGGGTPAASRIAEFSRDGKFLLAMGSQGTGNGQFVAPEGIAVDKQGRIMVCDFGNSRLCVFAASGAWIGSFGTSGSARGQFGYPRAVAIAPDGTVLVADVRRNRVLRLRIVDRLFEP
jgi:DNA-binding beta-propeller fold protein YncE